MTQTEKEPVNSGPIVRLTDRARDKIIGLMKREHPDEERALRVSVVGGGCSGFSYKLGFELSAKEGDHVFKDNSLQLFVDLRSALFLEGMTIDYDDGLNGAGFIYDNPKASKSCGCGTSFSI